MLIYDLTYQKLLEKLLSAGYKKYRVDQIWNWLYQYKVTSFDQMTNLPKELLDYLKETFILGGLLLERKVASLDGTLKFLFRLKNGFLIESVLMNHHYGKSVCVTSQVGCNIGCTFCASGKLLKKHDLTPGEMLMQVLEIERLTNDKVNSVVIMGIGEPFDNFDNVIDFIEIINHQKGLDIGARKITVSTSGLVPKIYAFADLKLQVNLALSLHAPTNEIRSSLMRINESYPIEEVMAALKYYLDKTKRRVTIEYILINEVNDRKIDALNLAELLKGLNVYVNLIPYNEVIEAPYQRPKRERQLKFLSYLKENQIDTTLRQEHGHDINAACGQLRSMVLKKDEKSINH